MKKGKKWYTEKDILKEIVNEERDYEEYHIQELERQRKVKENEKKNK